MNPRQFVEDAFAAFEATRGQSPAVQAKARKGYDDAVREYEAREPSGIRGTRDRTGLPSKRPARLCSKTGP